MSSPRQMTAVKWDEFDFNTWYETWLSGPKWQWFLDQRASNELGSKPDDARNHYPDGYTLILIPE